MAKLVRKNGFFGVVAFSSVGLELGKLSIPCQIWESHNVSGIKMVKVNKNCILLLEKYK